MTIEDQGESKENLGMRPPNQAKEGNEGDTLANKKRNKKIASGSGKKIINDEAKDESCRERDHEKHILIERERRKNMSNLFSSLHALLPQPPSKAYKSTIVEEAVNYIKHLKHTVEELEKQKQERLHSLSTFMHESSAINSNEAFMTDHGSSNDLARAIVTTNTSNSTLASVPQQPIAYKTFSYPNVVLNICGNVAQFCVNVSRKPCISSIIAFVLETHKIEVISSNISCNGNEYKCIIHAQTNRASSHKFPETTLVEEVYKQAAQEIQLFI